MEGAKLSGVLSHQNREGEAQALDAKQSDDS